jgi:hypothetical protein
MDPLFPRKENEREDPPIHTLAPIVGESAPQSLVSLQRLAFGEWRRFESFQGD